MNLVRPLKVIILTLILGGLSVLSLSCASPSDSSAPENQVITVQRGNLAIDVTAAGNLALSRTEDLAFEMSGTVEEILVEEGEIVESGQTLARLDTSEWEDNLKILEDKLTTAERELTAKKRVLSTKQRDLIQAQLNLQTAEYNLDVMEEVQEARDAIKEAEWEKKFAEMMLQEASKSESDYGTSYWMNEVTSAKNRITEAQQELAEVLADPDNSGVSVTEVWLKKLAVDLAQKKLEAAQIDVEDARIAIEDARKEVKDADETLAEALEDSPEIVAPFDGFIIMVNVEGGDEVLKGTVAVRLADPNKFEADIMVSEMDILQIKLGKEANVQVDAMPGISLRAKVTHIAPTATIQSGVVNYKVKVEVQPLEAVTQKRREARQQITQGEIPEQLKQALEEGRITQEQVEEMMRMRQERGGQQRQMPAMIPDNFQLREGLTVTVSIIVEERDDVLLVPNKAIILQGTERVVQVLKDGAIEERSIRTGISDYQNTEVIDGLSEGEKVLVPQGTTTTLTTPQGGGRGGIRIPGIGRPPIGGAQGDH